MSMRDNMILKSDSYKYSHYLQYPRDTADISSYITARGTKMANCEGVVALGYQSTLLDFMQQRITMADVDQAEVFCQKHGLPFNREGFEIIVDEHGGKWPVQIQAVPEGTVVPFGAPILQIRTLDSRLAWVTSFLERKILTDVWYPSTVATLSRQIKKVIKTYLDETSDNADAELPFKLHDFGFRGASSDESAERGGFGHIVNFLGTDTVGAITHAMDYYFADVCAYSISASEHSTMTSWGREREFEAYRNMVDSYAKTGAIFACVIDSYDTFAAIDMFCDDRCAGGSLLDIVKNRGATIVLRPDSGDPVMMPVQVIERLLEKVGYTINSKGYKVLPDHVRVIQGDGINIDDVEKILQELMERGISAANIAFGMGGGLLQKVNRDTFKFAMKASQREDTNGNIHDVVKDPITDPGKKSLAGRLSLVRYPDGSYETIREYDLNTARKKGGINILREVYRHHGNDTKIQTTTLAEIRQRAAL